MFSAPLWLLGLLTLAVPLALHLWSRRPRDVIPVGSLRHVTEISETRAWSARLTQPLLLALRLGILACVVLALAGPRMEAGPLTRPDLLVLVEPGLLRDTALLRADPLLDSLARSRSTVRLLQPGLEKVQLDGIRIPFRAPGSEVRDAPRLGARHPEPGTLWSLLATADREFAPRQLLVIAEPRVAWLGGRRPALAARVVWHAPAVARAPRWTATRWRTGEGQLVTLTGTGDEHRASYQRETGPLDGCPACPAAPPIRVAIAAEDSGAARRLRLAAKAVALELGQPLALAPPDSADLLIQATAADEPAAPIPVLRLSPAVVPGDAVADSLWAHWPWSPLAHDPADPRLVSLRQARPELSGIPPRARSELRGPLLLLAALLLLLERWLSTRAARPA